MMLFDCDCSEVTVTSQKANDYVTISEGTDNYHLHHSDTHDVIIIQYANCYLDVRKATEISDAICVARTQDELRQAAHKARFFISELLQQVASGEAEREYLLQSFEDLGGDAARVRKLNIDVKQLRIILDCVRATRAKNIRLKGNPEAVAK